MMEDDPLPFITSLASSQNCINYTIIRKADPGHYLIPNEELKLSLNVNMAQNIQSNWQKGAKGMASPGLSNGYSSLSIS